MCLLCGCSIYLTLQSSERLVVQIRPSAMFQTTVKQKNIPHPFSPAAVDPLRTKVPERFVLFFTRVGQNRIHTVYIWYFGQGNHLIYGHIQRTRVVQFVFLGARVR